MTTGEERIPHEGDGARPFDFRAPGNGGRDPQLDVFARMHDVFAQTVASAWSKQLRCDVALAQTTIARVTFDDVVRVLPTPTVLHEVALSPLSGTALVELDPELAMIMLDRTLGGHGGSMEPRRLTVLEEDLLADVVDQLRVGLAATFDPLVDVTPEFGPMQSDPEFLATAEPTDAIVLVAFQVTLTMDTRSADATLTLAYPLAMLAPVLERLQAHDSRPVGRAKGPIDEALPEVPVEVAVRFRPTRLPASDLAGLQVGDVLTLDHRADDAVLGWVGDAAVFEAHVGRRGPRMAVRIARVRSQPAPESDDATTPDGLDAPTHDLQQGEQS